jgi:hypothetical protein
VNIHYKFEYELVDKTECEEVSLHIQKQTFYTYFEHLHPPIWGLFDRREDVHLKSKIAAVTAADNRAVVKFITWQLVVNIKETLF